MDFQDLLDKKYQNFQQFDMDYGGEMVISLENCVIEEVLLKSFLIASFYFFRAWRILICICASQTFLFLLQDLFIAAASATWMQRLVGEGCWD